MTSKQTSFNDNWLTDTEFKCWVGKDPKNVNKARCVICGGGSFSLGNMGKQALRSHAKGKKHTDKLALVTKIKKENTMMSHLVKVESTASAAKSSSEGSNLTASTNVELPVPEETSTQMLEIPPPTDQPSTSTGSTRPISQWTLKEETLKAEVLWAMKTLNSKYSTNSCQGNNELFCSMFPDSEIAKQFQCSKTKCSYLISYGLAPFYHDKLLQQLQDPEQRYVISFDESLNKTLQQEQMDMLVRIWDCNINRVQTRYFNSQFLGHTRASDLVTNFKSGIQALRYCNLLQISMDGPATNWKFFDEIVKDRKLEDPNMPGLLNLGSCGLHVVHGSFKTGASATGWELDSLLRSLWYVFEDSPARREDYESIGGSGVFPLRFCSTRWLEDISVAQRAIEIWSGIVKYVRKISTGPKSKVPSISSFQKLVKHVQDPLTIAKLQFFINVAETLQPFLKKFQGDNPLLPFLAEELYSLLKLVLDRFIKPEVLNKANTKAKLANIDVMAAENVVHAKNVELGFATLQHLRKAEREKTVSDLQILTFRKECTLFLQKLCMKLLERCPLKYSVVRYLVSLNPKQMAKHPESSNAMFSKLLQCLIDNRIRDAKYCDTVMQQYKKWLADIVCEKKEVYESYSIDSKEGIDTLFYKDIGEKAEYQELFRVVKDMLILSHGQSSVERGFSDNKELLKGNMNEHTLITYRQAYDGLKSQDKPLHECVSKELLQSCKHAYHRYKSHAQESKAEDEKKQKDKQREETQRQLDDAKKKVASLGKMADKLVVEADELARQAETKNNLQLLVKSNALREKSHGKRKEMECEVKTAEHLEKKLKQM